MADLDVRSGRPNDACRRLQPLLDTGSQALTHITEMLPTLAGAYLASGNLDRAAEVLAEIDRRVPATGMEAIAVPALLVRAGLLSAGGEAGAESMFEEVVRRARAMPYPHLEATALYQQGMFYRRQEMESRARERFQQAFAIFRHLGAKKDIERTEQALAASG